MKNEKQVYLQFTNKKNNMWIPSNFIQIINEFTDNQSNKIQLSESKIADKV